MSNSYTCEEARILHTHIESEGFNFCSGRTGDILPVRRSYYKITDNLIILPLTHGRTAIPDVRITHGQKVVQGIPLAIHVERPSPCHLQDLEM